MFFIFITLLVAPFCAEAGKDSYVDASALCKTNFPNYEKSVVGLQLPYSCAVNCVILPTNCSGGSFSCKSQQVGQIYVPEGSACSKWATYETGTCVNHQCIG